MCVWQRDLADLVIWATLVYDGKDSLMLSPVCVCVRVRVLLSLSHSLSLVEAQVLAHSLLPALHLFPVSLSLSLSRSTTHLGPSLIYSPGIDILSSGRGG